MLFLCFVKSWNNQEFLGVLQYFRRDSYIKIEKKNKKKPVNYWAKWPMGLFLLQLYRASACLNNTYGVECLETCGKCLSEQQCNHINGTCTNGCETGYYSDRCKRGIVLTLKLTYTGMLLSCASEHCSSNT